MSHKIRKKIIYVIFLIIVFSIAIWRRERVKFVVSNNVDVKDLCIMIDAGHGGDDPGKVGINNILEKDINIKIAKLLKKELEKTYHVELTREDDNGLYDEDAYNHKVQDMQRRCALIMEKKVDIFVSIHQNSYTSEAVKGAQVFYYAKSVEGERLAHCIQDKLVEQLDKYNKRKEKANNNYYLLKKTAVPAVIVECGFLSNTEEAQKLSTEEYQKKVAAAIADGIDEYINSNKK